jgi:hypothetical protein
MTRDEYSLLFHELGLNRVAFMRLMDCDEAVLKLVNAAVEQEREACAKVCEAHVGIWIIPAGPQECAAAIRARGEK